MITKMQIKNIHSIKNAAISFEKSRYQYLEENVYNDKLVNPIGIYGANGSGKTSLILPLAMLAAILWKEPGNYSLFIPNVFFKDSSPSELEIWFELGNDEFQYIIKTKAEKGIIEEELISNNKRIFYKKDSYHYIYNNQEETLESDRYSVLRKLANDSNDEKIIRSYNFLSNISYLDASNKNYISKLMAQKSINDLMVEKSSEVKEILNNYEMFPTYDYKSTNLLEGHKRYFIGMNIAGQYRTIGDEYMSSGMYNQSVMLSVLTALPANSVIVIDEIEDALHPITIMDFIDVIRRKNVQLIFTSHNTYILQKLRPDQIIFSHWNVGYSSYKKLSNIYPNIREVNNIEKMYLSHMFDEEIESNE